MGGWRWHSSAGGFRGGAGVMLVLLLLLGISWAHPKSPQTACEAASYPQSLIQPQYLDTEQENTSVGFMKGIVQSFLKLVQPNPFPKDLILKLIEDYAQAKWIELVIKDILRYERGFLICVAIGILYVVLMPVIGFFVACCRCCGNCGGKMYQRQTSEIDCRRKALCCSVFITTAIICAGNVCMFLSNETFKMSVEQGPVKLSNSLDNINTFVTSVPQQMDFVVSESFKTIQEVTRNLEDIGSKLGKGIQARFKESMNPVLQSVDLLDQDTMNLSNGLKKLISSLDELKTDIDRIENRFENIKSRISRILARPRCTGCDAMETEMQGLTMDTSISVSSLSELQSAVNESKQANMQSRIQEMEDYFQSIPKSVSSETKDIVQSSIQLLVNVEAQISQITSYIPLMDMTTNVTMYLDQARNEIDKFTPKVKGYERIRYGVCFFLCIVVLLVVVCNFLGVCLGPLGLTPKVDPTKRSFTADCGGTFLMAAAGFSFLFCWLFMIVVLILFLLSGNVYALVCRPWRNGQLLKFIETPGLVPGLEIGAYLGLESNLTLTDIYRDCDKNRPVWTTLHMHELIDLEDVLNVSKYTEDIQMNFDKVDINLSSVTLLRPEVQNQLRSISTKAGNFDSASFTDQMDKFFKVNLDPTADKLDQLADFQSVNDIRRDLQREARIIRRFQNNIERTVHPLLKEVISIAKELESTGEKFNGTVGDVLNNVEAAQDFLNTNTTQIVKTESRKFLDCQLEHFTAYAHWANTTITQELGRCGPVAGAVNSVEVILCAYMVESLNAFWFSLGWCMIFFVPGIIFSIKLAKYYRKMKYSDVYDNNMMMAQMPQNPQIPQIPPFTRKST